jgi:superfamily II DNA or RNA helicase
MSYLGNRGYTIKKELLEEDDIKLIKKELCMMPFVPKTSPGKPSIFPIYRESSKKLYLPRFYGYENYGTPEKDILSNGKDINVTFKGSLRDYQKDIVNQWISKTKKTGCGLIEADCGAGKCHAFNTPILMFNGSIKMVQNIKVGDQLMGDDSTPRNVLSLARGREMLYDVIPSKGRNYTVNESHILSLKLATNNKIWTHTTDIPLVDYLNLPEYKKSFYKGFKVGVEFQEKSITVEPYSLGYRLANETYSKMNINIPFNYKCNIRSIRLQLLAGIIDAVGFTKNNGYDIIQKSKTFLDDIIFIARSLGFAAYKLKYKKGKLIYYKTHIYGENIGYIPLKLKEKVTQETKNALIVDIRIKRREVDNYYGFQLDGNHRYLLDDFTVTHNTVIATNIISKLQKKTLIIVHKDFLLKQWEERLNEFLPDARIGFIQGPTIDIEDKDIVIGMLQSLSMKDYDIEIFKEFGFTIVDETHHISAEVFSRVLFKAVTKHMLGLSATMERKDGLTKVFKMFMGDIVATWKRKSQNNVTVKAIEYTTDDEHFNLVAHNYRGQTDYVKMISKLCDYTDRTNFILRVIEDFWREAENDQIIIIGHRKNQLCYIHDKIKEKGFATVGYYVGGMKDTDLKISEGKNIIIATYSMAEEALDIKSLTSIAMITPKRDVRQAVGRILRSTGNKTVFDFIDVHSNFKKYWYDRKRWYHKQSFNINYCLKDDFFKNNWTTIENKKNTKQSQKNPEKSYNKSNKLYDTNMLVGKCLTIEHPGQE